MGSWIEVLRGAEKAGEDPSGDAYPAAMKRLLPLSLLALSSVACAAPKVAPQAPVAAKPVAPVVAKAEPKPAPEAPKAPAIPEAISSLATDAKNCDFSSSYGFDYQCQAWDDWRDEEEAFADGKGDEALLLMLQSTDVKDRYLAASKMSSYGMTVISEEHAGDAAFIDRVLVLAQKERKPLVARSLAMAVTRLDLVGADRLTKAIDIAKNHKVEEYRREFAMSVGLFAESRGEETLAWGEELAKDEHDLGRSLIARHARVKSLAERACKDLSGLRKDSDPYTAAGVLSDLASSPYCRTYHESVVKDIAAMDLTKADEQRNRYSPTVALQSICWDPDTTSALKAKALVQAKRITDAKAVPGYVRASALNAVNSCDAKAGQAYATKFAKDKDLGPTAKWITGRAAAKSAPATSGVLGALGSSSGASLGPGGGGVGMVKKK